MPGVRGGLTVDGIASFMSAVHFDTQTVTTTSTIDDKIAMVVILENTTNITVALPPPVKGKSIVFRKWKTGSSVTVSCAGTDRIEGNVSYSMAQQSKCSLWLVSDGINWFRIVTLTI